MLQKGLWPKKRAYESSYVCKSTSMYTSGLFITICRRNSVNILLYLAEQVKLYFPSSEIRAMLDTFPPLINQSVCAMPLLLDAFQCLTLVDSHHDPCHDCFPSSIRHSPLCPSAFQTLGSLNSEVISFRLVDLCWDFSEEHTTGNPVKWKDMWTWTDAEWVVLVGKALASMSKHILPEPVFS